MLTEIEAAKKLHNQTSIVVANHDGVLAHAESIPQLDGFVSRTGNDLTVISWKRYTQHILRVTNKRTSGTSATKTAKKIQYTTAQMKPRETGDSLI